MIQVLIVDDNKVIREVLKRTVSDEFDMQVTGDVASAKAAYEFLSENEVNLVLLDINMPEINGIKALKKLRKLYPQLPVLMVSAMSEEIYAKQSIKIGASGFVNKENAFSELAAAIRMAYNGEIFNNSRFSESLN